MREVCIRTNSRPLVCMFGQSSILPRPEINYSVCPGHTLVPRAQCAPCNWSLTWKMACAHSLYHTHTVSPQRRCAQLRSLSLSFETQTPRTGGPGWCCLLRGAVVLARTRAQTTSAENHYCLKSQPGHRRTLWSTAQHRQTLGQTVVKRTVGSLLYVGARSGGSNPLCYQIPLTNFPHDCCRPV